jgi:predicted transcriptional regulator of viral defense system
MAHPRSRRPSWDDLFDLAAGQEGLFSIAQAAEAGYSPQLLQKHLRAGRVRRLRRGVYRLVHFPPGEHEDLAAVWLWSNGAGVFSHETALSLHGLSDVLPSLAHLTVPSAWRRRRLRVPQGVVLSYSDVPKEDRTWVGPVPVTTVRKTLADSIAARVAPDLVRQAIGQAADRGLVPRDELVRLSRSDRVGDDELHRVRAAGEHLDETVRELEMPLPPEPLGRDERAAGPPQATEGDSS